MEITKEMRDVALQIAQAYKDLIAETGTNASGKLSNFKTECVMSGSFFEVYFNLQDYWKYVENGRKAGKFPPVNAIKDWIQIKPVVPRAINGRVPTTDQLAYLISRKIATKGIEPKKLLKRSLEDSKDKIDLLVSLITEQLEIELNNEINNL